MDVLAGSCGRGKLYSKIYSKDSVISVDSSGQKEKPALP